MLHYYMSQSCKPLCGNHEIYCITSRKNPLLFQGKKMAAKSHVAQLCAAFAVHDTVP